MELPDIIDDLLRKSTDAHNQYSEAVREDKRRDAETHLYKHVTLLHAAKLIDSAMKRDRYMES